MTHYPKLAKVFLVLGICSTPFSTYADVPSDPVESAEWKTRILSNIANDSVKPSEEAIPLLAERLYALSQPWNRSPDSKVVLSEIQRLLIAIPGHAKYYQNKIEAMRLEVLANAKKSDDEISEMKSKDQEVADEWSYIRYCAMIAFPTLGQMPSSESVTVLGHYLTDPQGRNGKTLLGHNLSNPGDDFAPRRSNADEAAIAIRNLGIEHPPFKLSQPPVSGAIYDGETDAWKDWWNEIKEGRRTYRFIGSNIEYGPDGPASKEVIQRAERNRKRDDERAAGHKKSTPVSGFGAALGPVTQSSSIAGILLGLALLAVAAWYFLKSRAPRK